MERDERNRRMNDKNDEDINDRFNRDNRRWHNINQEFENDYQNHREDRSMSANRHFSNNDRFEDYTEQDFDLEHDYYDNLRSDQNRMDNIRQGYGFSSFEGNSSGRNNMAENMRLEREAQRQHPLSRNMNESQRPPHMNNNYRSSNYDRGHQ